MPFGGSEFDRETRDVGAAVGAMAMFAELFSHLADMDPTPHRFLQVAESNARKFVGAMVDGMRAESGAPAEYIDAVEEQALGMVESVFARRERDHA